MSYSKEEKKIGKLISTPKLRKQLQKYLLTGILLNWNRVLNIHIG